MAAVPFVGVVRVPEATVHLDIQRQVAAILSGVPKGQTMVVLNVATGSGVNLAVAHRIKKNWTVEAWVGSKGWHEPIEGGVTVAISR